MTEGSHFSIWYFVGILLAFYGVIITAMGLYGFYEPTGKAMAEYHADLWWGLILLALGVFYTWHFAPHRAKPQEPVSPS